MTSLKKDALDRKISPFNQGNGTAYPILFMLSCCHLFNDTIQSLIPAIHPVVKESFQLNFSQIGLLVFVFQLSSSIMQPLIGFITDRKPYPYLFPVSMLFSLLGLVTLALASSYGWLLMAVVTVGAGSAIFHPVASRIAYVASGAKRGFAQSLFQLGGNVGTAMGPILAAVLIAPYGKKNVLWLLPVALLAMGILYRIACWYKPKSRTAPTEDKNGSQYTEMVESRGKRIVVPLAILLLLIFSKYFYSASLSSYYTFYLMDKFALSVRESQVYLFVYLLAVAVGTMIGGALADRIGRKNVILFSIFGASPFTLVLPHSNLICTVILTVIIGLIIASAFSAIVVYAQELLPGNVGMVSGLFFGLSFGMAGIGSAVLGKIADSSGIDLVYRICAFLPLIGVVAVFLPDRRVEKVF